MCCGFAIAVRLLVLLLAVRRLMIGGSRPDGHDMDRERIVYVWQERTYPLHGTRFDD